MNTRVAMRITAVAAVVAFVCVLIQAFTLRLPDATTVQPSVPPVPLAQFVAPINQHAAQALRFFAADSLFIISYLMVYAGLYTVASRQARAVAAVGLGAGILGGLFDALENAFFISYASLALRGQPLTDPALPLIFIIANLKWLGALVAYGAFGLAWPRRDGLSWAMSVLMMLVPLVGAVAVALPDAYLVLAVFILIGMPLFAWYFWREPAAAPVP